MNKPKFLTTVLTEFLKSEYEQHKAFQRGFKTYDEFESVMKDQVKACKNCGCIIWKGCDYPCLCRFK